MDQDIRAQYRIYKLGDNEQVKSFDCGDVDLNDFILNDAFLYRKEKLAVTYIYMNKDNSDDIAAFFCLANDRISLADFGTKSRYNRLSRRFANPKRLKSYPAAKIGRLGVSASMKGKEIGSTLIDFIKNFFLVDNKTGCRFITVDAYAEAVPFYVKGDTVINEKKCVMTNIITYFLGGKGLCFYEENDSVFYYNETTESFQILYDFSLQAGDSYVICPSDRFINDSLFVFIDSVTSVWVNGVSLRVQYVHTQSVSHTERPNFWQIGDMNKAVIYETIGSLNFFIPQEDGWNDDFFSHLCQYSGNSIYYKQNPDENCDTKSRITEADNIGCLHICPNPASKYVDVSISEETSGKENEWTVVDVLGHVVYRNVTAASEVRIPLDGMSKGLYVVRYCSGNDIRHGRFVIL